MIPRSLIPKWRVLVAVLFSVLLTSLPAVASAQDEPESAPSDAAQELADRHPRSS